LETDCLGDVLNFVGLGERIEFLFIVVGAGIEVVGFIIFT